MAGKSYPEKSFNLPTLLSEREQKRQNSSETFHMLIWKPKGSLLNLAMQKTLVYLRFTQHFWASPLPMQSNWWEAGNYYLDSATPKTGTDSQQTNFFCKTKVSGEEGKKKEDKVPWKDGVTWHEGWSRSKGFRQSKQGVTPTSIPKKQSPTHPDPGKEVCKHSSPPSSAGSSVHWWSCRKELWHNMCVTSSAVRREEKPCWLLSLRLHSCRHGGRNTLWGECPHSASIQLTVLTMPFTPFFIKDSGKSRMHPKELEASKDTSRVWTCKWWKSYFYTTNFHTECRNTCISTLRKGEMGICTVSVRKLFISHPFHLAATNRSKCTREPH